MYYSCLENVAVSSLAQFINVCILILPSVPLLSSHIYGLLLWLTGSIFFKRNGSCTDASPPSPPPINYNFNPMYVTVLNSSRAKFGVHFRELQNFLPKLYRNEWSLRQVVALISSCLHFFFVSLLSFLEREILYQQLKL